MKSRLFLLVLSLLLTVEAGAAPFRLRPRRRPIIQVPWQTVAAGGAAAGTMIAAYKISDGYEQGMKTVAREKPEVFAEHFSVFPRALSWGVLVLLAGGGYIFWRRYRNKEKQERKEQ